MNKKKCCKKCNEIKELKLFSPSPDKKDGVSYACKKCLAVGQKLRRNEGRYKNTDLNRLYGISLDQYDEMFNKQKGLCRICNKTQYRSLLVDHDHNTGAVRGLLCFKCNTGLGNMGDSIEILKNAIEYLSQSKQAINLYIDQ